MYAKKVVCSLVRRHVVFVYIILAMVAGSASVIAGEFSLGVYYYPGWRDNAALSVSPTPWKSIMEYPERKPLLGWYKEGVTSVMSRQLSWMGSYGINFIVFDWYFGRDGKVYSDHALNAYLKAPDKRGVKFSIMWANHTDYMFTKLQLKTLVNLWCSRYLKNPNYQLLDGKPVVYIFSAKILTENIKRIGMTTEAFFAYANRVAKKHGLNGIAFIAGSWSNDSDMDYLSTTGYAGHSGYNYHSPVTFRYSHGKLNSHSYEELDSAYRDHWHWMLRHSEGAYITPITAGWDKRPWGGSADPLHDNSRPTADEFETHLLAAKKFMLSAPERTKKTAVICCWNEFGEGSYIEPTVGSGFMFLEKIKKVFATE